MAGHRSQAQLDDLRQRAALVMV